MQADFYHKSYLHYLSELRQEKEQNQITRLLRTSEQKEWENVCPTLKRHRKGKYTSGSLYLSPVVPESGDISATARRRLSFLCPKQTSVLRKSTCVFTKGRMETVPQRLGRTITSAQPDLSGVSRTAEKRSTEA